MAQPPDGRPNASAPSFAPIERFVREVLPTVDGPHQVTDSTRHIALIRGAATARGLKIRTIGGTAYFYDGRLPVGGMTKWVPTLVSGQARVICASKDLTKQMLTAAGLPAPSGIALNPDQLDDAIAHLRAVDRPLVLKPVTAKGGDGITCGITTEDDLRAAWETAEQAVGDQARLLLEEQVDGVDIRAFVVGRRVAAATTRIHAHVVGDGHRSITELLELKQRWRDQHALLLERTLTVDATLLARGGRTIDDVPADGEVVVLNNVANLHVGGENVDVTEIAHPDLLKLAVDAVRAIPGLGLAGVDLLAPDLGTADGAVVLEANVQANIRMHHFPAYGKPRDVAGAIIDEMIATAGAPPRRAKPKAGLARRVARAAKRRLSAG
jgi:cyanophycin synthetase